MRAWLFGLLGLSLAAPACESDHGALAKGSSGGAAGRPNMQGGAQSSGGINQVPAHGGVSGSGGRLPDEPPGESVLTLVHGVVDAGPILFCFAKGSGDDTVVLGAPQPEGGLAYASSFVVRSIDGLDWQSDDLSTWVITGDLSLVAGLDCQTALDAARATESEDSASPGVGGAGGAGAGGASGSAGASGEGGSFSSAPPDLRVARLPTVPAGTLSVGRSALFVADGCIGGAAFQSRLAENACGEGYSAHASTLSGVLVQMSRRTSTFRLGLQAVHASVASSAVNIISAPINGEQPLVGIASDLELGAIVPRIPDLAFEASAYGVKSGDWRVEVSQGATQVLAERWSDIIARSSGAPPDNGHTYALVLLGPGLGLPLTRTQLWNPSRLALVPTDP